MANDTTTPSPGEIIGSKEMTSAPEEKWKDRDRHTQSDAMMLRYNGEVGRIIPIIVAHNEWTKCDQLQRYTHKVGLQMQIQSRKEGTAREEKRTKSTSIEAHDDATNV